MCIVKCTRQGVPLKFHGMRAVMLLSFLWEITRHKCTTTCNTLVHSFAVFVKTYKTKHALIPLGKHKQRG